MRHPGGRRLSSHVWSALTATQLRQASADGSCDPRLTASADWVEGAYTWQVVSLGQQYRSKMAAAAAGQLIYYVQAADRPDVECTKDVFEAMLSTPFLTTTKKRMGWLPLYVGQRVRLLVNILSPEPCPDRVGTVMGTEIRAGDLLTDMCSFAKQ